MKKILVGALQKPDSSYSFSMNRWHNPLKDIPVGTLVRFVSGSPRFKGEGPRDPGAGNDGEPLLGQLAVTVTTAGEEAHGWGGIFHLNTVRGDSFSHYGDFLEVV